MKLRYKSITGKTDCQVKLWYSYVNSKQIGVYVLEATINIKEHVLDKMQ